jgi:hypothetical protein
MKERGATAGSQNCYRRILKLKQNNRINNLSP